MPRNLVIVRAGDRSAHPEWLRDPHRNWDLAISYYGADPEQLGHEFVFKHVMPVSKFTAVAALLSEYRDTVYSYERIVLADDDIQTDTATLNRFFEITEEYGLELSQPALHEDSFFSHAVTLRNPLFKLRFSNFVEIMLPCFARDFLRTVEGSFGENRSGWGLDFLWPRLVSARDRIAIVDETPVLHDRPVGGPMHGYFAAQGIDPLADLNGVLAKYAFRQGPAVATGGIGTDGAEYGLDGPSRDAFIARLLAGYAQVRPRQEVSFDQLVRDSLRPAPEPGRGAGAAAPGGSPA
ncbi:DUF707 domain-containing protein [Methylobacterium sp. WSM2598]|uniref:DUF707 domain-containing protein n=1 Tax=Methylobacterium sp. WSM2598 TaxID=398261 RepID=UPI000367A825|nr:DUF707 domain-containing protein [Methylobacterium sp. WSM2598]